MKHAEKKKTAKKFVIISILFIFLLISSLAFVGFIKWQFPEAIEEAKSFLKPSKTVIVHNQTVENKIDQRTSFWDFAKLFSLLVFALIMFAGLFFMVFIIRRRLNPSLERTDVIKIHRDMINADEGHYRFDSSTAGDEFAGTMLQYHKYFDGTDLKSGKSYQRAVTFWSLHKLPPNTPISTISKHQMVWIDTSIENEKKAKNDVTGPVYGENWRDWQEWKKNQRHGLIGAPSSPVMDEQIMTPEEQKEHKEKMEDIIREAIVREGMS